MADKKPIPAGYVRVRVRRNHDSPNGILKRDEIVAIPQAYYQSQTETTIDGHTIKVEPPVFELVKE